MQDAEMVPSSVASSHGVITLRGYGVQVRVDRGHLILKDGVATERRTIRLPRVRHGLRRLFVVSSDGMISLTAVRWLVEQKISLTVVERDGTALATTIPSYPNNAGLRRSQSLAHISGAALRVARELLCQKLTGQEIVARNKLLDAPTADTIAQFSNELASAETIASIRLIEAQAASAYWSSWRNLPVNFPRNDLHRTPQHWCTFGTRISPLTGSPRLAANPANAILNYLYGILESEARLAAIAIGLDPSVGILHADQQARDNLVYDIVEPVRPQVDAYLLEWLSKERLKRGWFLELGTGQCSIMNSLVSRLSQTAPVWARSLAMITESVAQALWRSAKKASNSDRSIPTVLTQRRRAEGRGNQFVVKVKARPFLRREKLCELCGAEHKKGRYCKSCGIELAREHMANVALIGHSKRKTRAAKARISQKLSDHAVANTWWSLSSLPAWLTEEFYVQKIQPRLKTVKVREIAQTMQVSQPYAALIRSGRRRPHPRHWQALARLAEYIE